MKRLARLALFAGLFGFAATAWCGNGLPDFQRGCVTGAGHGMPDLRVGGSAGMPDFRVTGSAGKPDLWVGGKDGLPDFSVGSKGGKPDFRR